MNLRSFQYTVEQKKIPEIIGFLQIKLVNYYFGLRLPNAILLWMLWSRL